MSGLVLWGIGTLVGSTVGAAIGTTIGKAVKNRLHPTVVEIVVPLEHGVEIDPDIIHSIKTLM